MYIYIYIHTYFAVVLRLIFITCLLRMTMELFKYSQRTKTKQKKIKCIPKSRSSVEQQLYTVIIQYEYHKYNMVTGKWLFRDI